MIDFTKSFFVIDWLILTPHEINHEMPNEPALQYLLCTRTIDLFDETKSCVNQQEQSSHCRLFSNNKNKKKGNHYRVISDSVVRFDGTEGVVSYLRVGVRRRVEKRTLPRIGLTNASNHHVRHTRSFSLVLLTCTCQSPIGPVSLIVDVMFVQIFFFSYGTWLYTGSANFPP